MTTITPSQWDSMGQRSFESKLVAVIRQNHPAQSADVDDATLLAEIRRQVARAGRYDMTDDLSAATYVYSAWLFGPEFDERIPSLAQILQADSLSPAAKTNALNNFSHAVFHALDAGTRS